MNELIEIKNGQLASETINTIKNYEIQMKAIKEQYDKFKSDLLEAMEKNGIIKFSDETNEVNINYIAESERETFDSKKFKEDMPELYDEYIKFSKVKPSIRIKVENESK